MPERPKTERVRQEPRRFVFLTLPQYTMIALSCAVDALRMANRVTGREAYQWVLATLDGQPGGGQQRLAMAPRWRWTRCCPATWCSWSPA